MTELPLASLKEIKNDLGRLMTFGNPDAGIPGTILYVKRPDAYQLDGQQLTQVTLFGGSALEEKGMKSARVQMLSFSPDKENRPYQTTTLRTHPDVGEQIPWKNLGGVRMVDSQGNAIDIPKKDLRITKPHDTTKPHDLTAGVEEQPGDLQIDQESTVPAFFEIGDRLDAGEIDAPESASPHFNESGEIIRAEAQASPQENAVYPRYVNGRQVTRAELGQDTHFQETLALTREVLEVVKAARGELDEVKLLDEMAEQIREVGRYSAPQKAQEAAYQQFMAELGKRGLNHDEALLAVDYLADEVKRRYNTLKLNTWEQEFKTKYGADAGRLSVLDTVERDDSGEVAFDPDAAEMLLTREDRNAGYQDLRTLQLVGDYLLDTFDPQARSTWTKDGQFTPQGVNKMHEYHSLLYQIMRGEVPVDQAELAQKLRTKYAEYKSIFSGHLQEGVSYQQAVDKMLELYQGFSTNDKARTQASVERWRTKHNVEPYRPGDMDLLFTKGLLIAIRRAEAPKDLYKPTDVFHRKKLKEKPQLKKPTDKPVQPEKPAKEESVIVEEIPKTPEAKTASEKVDAPPAIPEAITVPEVVTPVIGPVIPEKLTAQPEIPIEPATELPAAIPVPEVTTPPDVPAPENEPQSLVPVDIPPNLPETAELHRVITAVAFEGAASQGRDIARMMMEETQYPGLIATVMRRSLEARTTGQDQVKAEFKAVGEWWGNLKQERVGNYVRRAARNLFKHHALKEWYTEKYRQFTTEAVKKSGTHLLEETWFDALEQAKQELWGDKYWTGGTLGFKGRLKARARNLFMGSERLVLERTLGVIDEWRQSGRIAELQVHNQATDAVLTRFTDETEDLIHKKAGEQVRILTSDSQEDQRLTQGIRDIMFRHLKGETGFATEVELDRQYQDFMRNAFTGATGSDARKFAECDFYISTLREVALSLKQELGLAEHAQGLDALDEVIRQKTEAIEVRLGLAKVGARTENVKTTTEKILEKIPGLPLVSEAALGAGVALALSALVKTPQLAGRKIANTFLPVIGGAAVGGLMHGIVVKARAEGERLHDLREREKRKSILFTEDMPRRKWYEQFLTPQKGAVELANDLRHRFYDSPDSENPTLKQFSTEDELRTAVASLADVRALINLSDDPSLKEGFIAYSSTETIDPERTALDLTKRRVERDLITFMENPANQALVQQITGGASWSEFLQNVTTLQERQYRDGHDTLVRLINEGKVSATQEERKVAEEATIAVAKGQKELHREFRHAATKRAFAEGAKAFVVGVAVGEVMQEMYNLPETVQMLNARDLPTHVTPLQWILAKTNHINPDVKPPEALVADMVDNTLTKVHLPASTDFKDANGDGVLDLVDKSSGKILAQHIMNQDGTLTADGAANLARDAHINLTSTETPIFQGTHPDTVGHNAYQLPNNVQFEDLDGDGVTDDLLITVPGTPGGAVSIMNASDANGGFTHTAITELQKYHMAPGTTTSEVIVGSGLDTAHATQVAPGVFANLRLPHGISAQDVNGDGTIDHLLVAANGKTVDVTVDSHGFMRFGPHAQDQFRAAGIELDDNPNSYLDVHTTAMKVGTKTITDTVERAHTEFGKPELDLNKINTTIIHRDGWWDNNTTGVYDGSELGMNISYDHGKIVITQALTSDPTSSWFDGKLDLHATAQAGNVAFQASIPDPSHAGHGDGFAVRMWEMARVGDRARVELNYSNPEVRELFSVHNGEVTPLFRVGEVVQIKGDAVDGAKLVTAISSQVWEQHVGPITTTTTEEILRTVPVFGDIPTTTLDIGPLIQTETALTFTGKIWEHVFTPQPQYEDVYLEGFALPFLGYRPLEKPSEKIKPIIPTPEEYYIPGKPLEEEYYGDNKQIIKNEQQINQILLQQVNDLILSGKILSEDKDKYLEKGKELAMIYPLRNYSTEDSLIKFSHAVSSLYSKTNFTPSEQAHLSNIVKSIEEELTALNIQLQGGSEIVLPMALYMEKNNIPINPENIRQLLFVFSKAYEVVSS